MGNRIARGRSRSATARSTVLASVLALIVLAGWSYSSPVASSPDEGYHLISIWCAAGEEQTSLCEPSGQDESRLVPAGFASGPCYAGFSDVSGRCQAEAFDQPRLVESGRGDFSGAYPPVFYTVMSAFVTDDVQFSVLAMRMLNASLFVVLLAAVTLLLPLRHRVMAVGSFLISVVPLGLFLIPSLNPSSWAIVGVTITWLGLLGFLDSVGPKRWALAAIFCIGAIMSAGARADAGVYVVLVILALLFLRFSPSRAFLVTSILPIAVLVGALALALSSSQLSSAAQGFGGPDSPGNAGPAPTIPGGPGEQPTASANATGFGLLLTNIVNVPSLWAGSLGFWSLGWFDTPLPAVVAFGGVGAWVAVAFSGLAHVDARKALVFAGAAVTLWFIPTFTLTRGGDQVGSEVQPRYLLPLIVVLAAIALLESRGRGLDLSRAQRWIVGLTLVGTQSLALYVNLRRYVTGDDVKSVNLDAGLEWWWTGVLSPMALWLVVTIAWAALVALLIRAAVRPSPRHRAIVAEEFVDTRGEASLGDDELSR
jgi:hypothetical protein